MNKPGHKGKAETQPSGSLKIRKGDILDLSNMRASLMAHTLKSLPAVQETQVQSLGQEDPLEKGMAAHSSILAWDFRGQRSLVGYSPWCRKKPDTTERLTFSLNMLSSNKQPVGTQTQGAHCVPSKSQWKKTYAEKHVYYTHTHTHTHTQQHKYLWRNSDSVTLNTDAKWKKPYQKSTYSKNLHTVWFHLYVIP